MQLGEALLDYTLRVVVLGAAALGATGGALGAFLVLRKQSLLGDAISHAALPGIGLAFLLTGSRSPLVLVLGAALAGWAGALAVLAIVAATRVKYDSALGIVLSVFFGVGLVVLTYIQRMPTAAQAGLDRFLFGQAATMLERDVELIALLGSIATAVALLFWKEFKLLAFDPDFGATLGLPMRRLDVLLTSMLVVAIVIGLQTVGVVLMSAMVVAPAAAARQWTDRFGVMVMLGAAFGAAAGVAGAVASSVVQHLPTGPTIVLFLSAIVGVSLTMAPNRGIVWAWIRFRRGRRRFRLEAVLADLYALHVQHEDHAHGHPLAVLEAMSFGAGGGRRSLARLEARGLAHRTDHGGWAITPQGAEAARRIAAAGGVPTGEAVP